MKIIKLKRKDGEQNAQKMKDMGYISRNQVINAKYRKKYCIPEYAVLRRMADADEIRSYKVITEESNLVSYWFNKYEIETLFTKNDSIKSENKEKELPLTFTVKIDEKHVEEVKNKCIQQIENKANELLSLTSKINKQKRDNVIIYCPYTIGAVQTIWNECIAAIQSASKLNITCEYAERKEKLDAGIPDNIRYNESKVNLDNYKFIK